MQLIDHVSIAVRDLERARPFYEAIFRALGMSKVYDRCDAIGFGERNRPGYVSIFQSAQAQSDPRRHWCFRAASEAAVQAFHAAGLVQGGTDAGPPGLRRHYDPGYYAAFLSDPEGNRIEAVCHGGDRE